MYDFAIKALKEAKENEEALMKKEVKQVENGEGRIGALFVRQEAIFDLEDAIMTLESIAEGAECECEGEADDS